MLDFVPHLFPRYWHFQLPDSSFCHYKSSYVLLFKMCCNKKCPASFSFVKRKKSYNQQLFTTRITGENATLLTERTQCYVLFIVPLFNHWMMLDGNRRNSKTSLSLTVKCKLSKTSPANFCMLSTPTYCCKTCIREKKRNRLYG